MSRKPFDPTEVRGVQGEPAFVTDRLTESVIGAAIEVHRGMGPGFPESVYEEAMSFEMTSRGIAFTRQQIIAVEFKGHRVGEGRLDFLVNGELIVELKAVEVIAPLHEAQVIAYLRATKHKRALLINFNVQLLKEGIKRISL